MADAFLMLSIAPLVIIVGVVAVFVGLVVLLVRVVSRAVGDPDRVRGVFNPGFAAVNEKFKNGTIQQEVRERLERRLGDGCRVEQDFFRLNMFYAAPPRSRAAIHANPGPSHDLYAMPDGAHPCAVTELMFLLSFGGFGKESLRRLKACAVTRTLRDEVAMLCQEGLFSVRLNKKVVGVIDLVHQRVLSPAHETVATIEAPPALYVKRVRAGATSVTPEVAWKLRFAPSRLATVYEQRSSVREFLLGSPPDRLVAEFSSSLSRRERALALGLLYFVKIKDYLHPR
ncbi:hypothetical protein JXA12_04105 [Candidatus Woesearchaeota archaeon]|nr:hypothetical protein [Candidatus Woesearchaeota archaeon]